MKMTGGILTKSFGNKNIVSVRLFQVGETRQIYDSEYMQYKVHGLEAFGFLFLRSISFSKPPIYTRDHSICYIPSKYASWD